MSLHQELDDQFGDRAPPAMVHDMQDLALLVAWSLWRQGGRDRHATLAAVDAFDGVVRIHVERLAAEGRAHEP